MSSERQIVVDYVLPDRRHSDKKQRAPLSSYTLALLKAQTPATVLGCNVVARVHDEQSHGPYDPATACPNILALTYLTTGAPRAYALSDAAFGARSHDGEPIKVVHGAVHATSLPLEAIQHANVVVRGEITPAFQRQILERALRMGADEKAVVRLARPPSELIRPPADWSWMRPKDYILAPVVQTSVGCPFGCDFCSVTQVFGAGMRAVSEECLQAELDTLPRKRILAIIDDNFLQGVQPRYIEHCLRVADRLRERGFRWVTEVTVKTLVEAQKRTAESRSGFDLIGAFAERGCRGLFLGIETISENGGLKKSQNIEDAVQLVRHCQSHGIGILGAFVLGLAPDETTDYAKRLLEFAIETVRLDFAQFSINTPMPGARNFVRGVRDGAIFNYDWELYDAEHCVMMHPRMSPLELEDSHRWLYREFYRYRSIASRYDLLPLLSLSPAAWRRTAIGLPVNFLLHRSNRNWTDRLDCAAPRAVLAEPDPAVLDQLQHAVVSSRNRDGDLYDAHRPDPLSLAFAEV